MLEDRYSAPQRWLHWIMAAMVLCALAAGTLIFLYGFGGLNKTFGGAVTGAIFKYHKTVGVLILALALLRIVLRLRLGAPAAVTSLTPLERRLSASVQGCLYLMLLAVPALGWLATAAGGYPVQFFEWTLPGLIAKNPPLSETLFTLHGLAALALVGLLGLHIAGALMHWLVKRDGVMRRMSLFG